MLLIYVSLCNYKLRQKLFDSAVRYSHYDTWFGADYVGL